jgi:hypothetical protein
MRTPQLTSKPIHANTCRPSGVMNCCAQPTVYPVPQNATKEQSVNVPQVMDLDGAPETNQAGDRIELLSCLANRFPKQSKARLLVLSEKLQFPSIGHTRGATMLEKQIDEIR